MAHPGIASTNLARHAASGKVTHALRFLFNDPATGALSILYAATQDVPGNSYIGPRGLASMKGHPALGKAASVGLDPDTAQRLWVATETPPGRHHQPESDSMNITGNTLFIADDTSGNRPGPGNAVPGRR